MVSFKLATRIAPRGHLAAEKRGEGFLFCFWGLREDSQSFPSGGPVNNTWWQRRTYVCVKCKNTTRNQDFELYTCEEDNVRHDGSDRETGSSPPGTI